MKKIINSRSVKIKPICLKCGYYTGNPKHKTAKCYTNKCPAKRIDLANKKPIEERRHGYK